MTAKTIIEKIWDAHTILERDGQSLLFIDRHYVHEGSHHAFAKLESLDREVSHPELVFGVADHYVPTQEKPPEAEVTLMIDRLARNSARHGIASFGQGDRRQGIVHVTMPEQGLTLPGSIVVCGDSHTATHGALGAFGFGIGASEVAHVLATQTLWQARPKLMRIEVEGDLPEETTAKDLALHIIERIGTGGATRHAVEYGGSTIRALSVEGRMTLCNMTIEMGARSGIVPPDETTFAWLEGRPCAPKGSSWTAALAWWKELRSDPGAKYDQTLTFRADEVAPMVTWGTSPEEVVPVDGAVPQDAELGASCAYMGLSPGQKIEGLDVDQVFIGSCTNARLSDLSEAAAVLRGRKIKVPLMVSPGSSQVAEAAEVQGIAQVFRDAGATWVGSGCSLCVGMNGDLVAPGARCASTTNRNFRGRQGTGARTHLMSPAMAAAAAVMGRIVDVRRIGDMLEEDLQ